MSVSFKKLKLNKYKLGLVSEEAGVYIFLNVEGNPVYVGKSVNLRKRLASYFAQNLIEKTRKMIDESHYFSTIRVSSELEALLLEAKLVKSYMPKYNSQLKDDKHPLYIRITKERYPRVLTARKIEKNEPNIAFYGPFPASYIVKNVLSMLRRVFPYSQHKLGRRGCLYSQMGLCNPCPSEIERETENNIKIILRKKYLNNLKKIKAILSGNLASVLRILEVDMKSFSKNENFEEAQKVRNQIERLYYVTQPIIPTSSYIENPNLIDDIRQQEIKAVRDILKKFMNIGKLTRIEAYDVAHLAGTYTSASMVTFIEGEPEKAFYRHFRIRHKKGSDDISSMVELAKRRSTHLKDWGVPDLILVDGGKGQVSSFWKIMREYGIPIIGLAKRNENLVIPAEINGKLTFKLLRISRGPALYLIQRVRDEAHRFARRLHHRLLEKNLISV